uniref:Mannose-6-phosphate isomerase n=1 Tax=Heterorhabditis bacteriophora TaxID=37862 RepID=A0A1I7WYE9_HETBA
MTQSDQIKPVISGNFRWGTTSQRAKFNDTSLRCIFFGFESIGNAEVLESQGSTGP